MKNKIVNINERINSIVNMSAKDYDLMLKENIDDNKIINAVELSKFLRTSDKRCIVSLNKNLAYNFIGTHYNLDDLTLKSVELLIIFGSDEYFAAISDLNNETIALTYYTDSEHVKAFRALQNKRLVLDETPKKLIK
ncbi:MAG: hypothetical protein RR359_04155 [Bacilli bacterium]